MVMTSPKVRKGELSLETNAKFPKIKQLAKTAESFCKSAKKLAVGSQKKRRSLHVLPLREAKRGLCTFVFGALTPGVSISLTEASSTGEAEAE